MNTSRGRTLGTSNRSLIPVLLVAILSIALTWLAVPGVFIIDECNYLTTVHALQKAQVTLPDSEGLPLSRELLYMAPEAPYWKSCPDPLAPSAPPLYAPLALPFATVAGWRGLVLLNAFAFSLCLLLVYRRTERLTSSPSAAALATITLGAATYLLDFAQGVWPHTLSMLLCTAGIFLLLPTTRRAMFSPVRTILAGVLLGTAAGIRYQNVVLAGLALAAALLLYGQRVRRTLAFVLGILPPLMASSLINLSRYGSWNPISKPSAGYVNLAAMRAFEEGRLVDMVADTMRAFGSRVIDFSLHHPLPVGFAPDPPSSLGVIMCMGVVKKAWMQSCPWLLLAALLVLLLLRPIRAIKGRIGPIRRELTATALMIGGILGFFAAAGSSRIDGMGFNQRYLIELLPLAAIALSLTATRTLRAHPKALAIGVILAVATALLLILIPAPGTLTRQIGLSKLPVVLAALTAVLWIAGISRPTLRSAGVACLGACLAWAATVHIAEEIPATRRMRRVQHLRASSLRQALPDDQATLLIGTWGCSLAAAPLELSHDGLIIVDPWIDEGADLLSLVDAAMSTERRVFVILNHLPPDLFEAITKGRSTSWAHQGDASIGDIGLVELLP